MAIGFSDCFDFRPVIGWELEQVTIDKYHVMFWFDRDRALLNVADKFSFRSSDGSIDFLYEIYGARKSLKVDSILRTKVADVRVVTKEQLDLIFENGDVLSVYDNPQFRSWWFLGGRELDPPTQRTKWSLHIGDREFDDLTEGERQNRQR